MKKGLFLVLAVGAFALAGCYCEDCPCKDDQSVNKNGQGVKIETSEGSVGAGKDGTVEIDAGEGSINVESPDKQSGSRGAADKVEVKQGGAEVKAEQNKKGTGVNIESEGGEVHTGSDDAKVDVGSGGNVEIKGGGAGIDVSKDGGVKIKY